MIGRDAIRDAPSRTLSKPNLILDPCNYPFALSNDLENLPRYVKITIR
jgi:hypothetical protein